MNNATGISSNSTSSVYNYSSSCKYRLPCGWCDRRNCLCTHYSYSYTTITGTSNDGYYANNKVSLTSKVDNTNFTEKHSVDGAVFTDGTRSEAFASSPVTTNI